MSARDKMMVGREVVERFFTALANEIAEAHPEYLENPFTVAEIYQKLVPYRTHRDVIGVEINGDYEDALLRLLAGEGDFLVLDSEPARRRIEDELRARNPNTGIYRDYAAVDVRLNPSRVPADVWRRIAGTREEHPVPEPEREGTGELDLEPLPGFQEPEPAGAPAEAGGSAGERRPEGAAPPTEEASAVDSIPSQCPDCRADLPQRDSLRFCPFCGGNVFTTECAACGEELERSWRFCLACGVPTGS